MFNDSSKLSEQTNKKNINKIFSGIEGDIRTRRQADRNEADAYYGESIL